MTPKDGKAPKNRKPAAPAPGTQPTAVAFLERLEIRQSEVEQAKYQRYFKTGKGDYAEGDFFLGVRMGEVFTLAKEFAAMTLEDLETLLEKDIHEARAGAVKIMSLQAQKKKTTDERRQKPLRAVSAQARPHQQLGPGGPWRGECGGRLAHG